MAASKVVNALFAPRFRVKGVSFDDLEILAETMAVERMPKGSQPLGIRSGGVAGTWVIDFAVPIDERGKSDPYDETFTFAFVKPYGEFEGAILANLGHIEIAGDRENQYGSKFRVLWISNAD